VTRTSAARAAAVLFIVTAALFVIGVSTEPGHNETAESTHVAETHGETTEGEATHTETAESGNPSHSEQGGNESVLGIDTESPAAVAFAVIVSLALAAGMWFRPARAVALAAVVFAALFTVFDIAEVLHQLDESRTGYAVLAAVIAAGHVLAAGASIVVARTTRLVRSIP
jgi:hypothetical protein